MIVHNDDHSLFARARVVHHFFVDQLIVDEYDLLLTIPLFAIQTAYV